MREKIFQQEIRESVLALFPQAFYLKIPDTIGTKANHPFDCLFSFPTPVVIDHPSLARRFGCYYFALELKQVRKGDTLPTSKVPKHQVEGLYRASQAGWNSYIVINYREDGENISYFIPINTWISYYQHAKSVAQFILSQDPTVVIIKREKIDGKTHWNLKKLFTQ
jgi:hypothetical protein